MTLEIGCKYSTIAPSELLTKVVPEYCIDNPLECLFWQRGANDTDQIRSAHKRYFLRVYRCGAYPRDAIEFEAEALTYLKQQGFPVAYPVLRKSGGYITEIVAPEGPRFVLITSVAEGTIADYESLESCRLVGESVAQFHLLSMGFIASHERSQLDLNGLLDNSMNVIRNYMAHHSSAIKMIEKIAQKARDAVLAVPNNSLDFGICHGDLHGGNLHIHEGKVTHFDFEECAFGYRLYDLATFKWGLGSDEQRKKSWLTFIEAYQSIRPINESAYSLINSFVVIRELAATAYGIRHVHDFGHNDIMASDIDQVCDRLNLRLVSDG